MCCDRFGVFYFVVARCRWRREATARAVEATRTKTTRRRSAARRDGRTLAAATTAASCSHTKRRARAQAQTSSQRSRTPTTAWRLTPQRVGNGLCLSLISPPPPSSQEGGRLLTEGGSVGFVSPSSPLPPPPSRATGWNLAGRETPVHVLPVSAQFESVINFEVAPIVPHVSPQLGRCRSTRRKSPWTRRWLWMRLQSAGPSRREPLPKAEAAPAKTAVAGPRLTASRASAAPPARREYATTAPDSRLRRNTLDPRYLELFLAPLSWNQPRPSPTLLRSEETLFSISHEVQSRFIWRLRNVLMCSR